MSIQKKGDIYYVVIPYRDEFNRSKNKWFKAGKSEKAAKDLEREMFVAKKRGELCTEKRKTVEQYLNEWLSVAIKPKRRPKTVENYQGAINNIVKKLGDIALDKLKPVAIEKHINAELERIKPTSVQYQYDVLNQALEKAVEWLYIPKNPCRGVDRPSRNEAKSMALTEEEAQVLIDITIGTELEIPVVLGLFQGLRRGEICGLRWSDVNFDKAILHIRHSLDWMDKEEAERQLKSGKVVWYGCESQKASGRVLALGPVKTPKSKAQIGLSAYVSDLLGRAKRQQEQSRSRKKVVNIKEGNKAKDGFVWVWPDERPHSPDYLDSQLRRVIQYYNKGGKHVGTKNNPHKPPELQLPEIRVHDLRHTHATLLYDAGMDSKAISADLRHTNSSFTDKFYIHLREKAQHRAASIMDAKFNKADESKKGATKQ
jgi:integrase